MRIVRLSYDGLLLQRDKQYLGRRLNWLEIFKLRGIGSSKFVYDSGIAEFDQLKERSADTHYVTLELLKEGFAIRYKRRNDYIACLVRYDELKAIQITSQRIRVSYRGKIRIVHQADIDVQLLSHAFKLQLHPMHYSVGIEFLEKKPLQPFCSVKLLLEIKEEATNASWIAAFLEGLK